MDASHWHQAITLATLHGKQAIIAPVLEPASGCSVVHVPEVNTDRFGTFTREPLAHLWSCGSCHHTEERRSGLPALADPARCDRCNP